MAKTGELNIDFCQIISPCTIFKSRMFGYHANPSDETLDQLLASSEYKRMCIFFGVIANNGSDFNRLSNKLQKIRPTSFQSDFMLLQSSMSKHELLSLQLISDIKNLAIAKETSSLVICSYYF